MLILSKEDVSSYTILNKKVSNSWRRRTGVYAGFQVSSDRDRDAASKATE